jgi:hypothetical protein
MSTKKNFMKGFLLLAFMLPAVSAVMAQGTPPANNNNELQNQDVIIQGVSQRKVEKAAKLPDRPAYRDSIARLPKVDYTAVPAQAATDITPEPLKAANLTPKEMLDKLYKFYARFGIGNYGNILGEAYFNQERNTNFDYGVHYKHLSSQGGINQVGFDGFANNELDFYSSRILNNYRIGVDLLYKRNTVYYYGFNPDSVSLNKGNTRQTYNTLWLRLSGASINPDDSNKVSHRENLGYRPYFDNRGASEHNVVLDLSGGKKVGHEFYNLGILADFNYFKDDSTKTLHLMKEPVVYRSIQEQTNLILGFNPAVNGSSGGLKWRAGLSTNADIYNGGGNFYFWFDLDISYSLFHDIFIPYIGTNRSTIRNSLYTLSQKNPFMLTNNDYINTNQNRNFYAGIRGTWTSNLSFNSKISYTINKNVPLFVNDTTFSYQNRFVVVYDDIDILTADAHILYRVASKWHVLLGGTVYKYNTTNETFAWHMPNYKVYSTFSYNLKDKIILRWNLEVLGKRKIYSLEPIAGVTRQPDGKYITDLKPYVDTDIQFEYRVTKRFSAFANFNNLAGRYLRFYNYPYQAFNVLGGITYMF